MANNEKYTNYQHVETAMVEYDEDMMIGTEKYIDETEYIGIVSQIYDNVHGNEEQVYVLTNNGTNRAAVPYSASDAERAQV